MSYNNPYGNPQNPYSENNYNGYTTGQQPAQGNPYESYELKGDTTSFFPQIQRLKDDLADYNNLIDRLERLQVKSLNAIGSDEINSIQTQIDSTSNNLEDLQGNTIKPKLQQLYKSCGQDTDKQQQAQNLTQQFRTAITRLAKIEDGYNQSNIDKAVDQYKIVNPQATDNQARDFVDQVGNQQVFDNAIAQSNRKGQAITVLQEVQARHQEVERTEKLAAELNQLFSELQNLVFEQDERFDSAIQNVHVAQDYLERGDANVIKARDHAKKGRKWKWIIFWAIVILIIVAVIIVLSVLHSTGAI
ncbi:DEKNAAC100266 [Brettanomyces naardenensis]|uniref:DEKNAAC100266 n=1 Tax=Brettanomyces naardenensis TaxID=13370 RepID=A0A448YFZ1_BRENA|nr:DEKNAAC100266 [Brettanomyces naardenensis]